MFAELRPLLKQRVVMITVSDIGDELLRVNVIPRKTDKDSDENPALTTPLSITGKAEELDHELAGQIVSFTESVLKTGSNLEELKTQHAAAVKAVEAENRKKVDDKRKPNSSKTAAVGPPNPAPAPEFSAGKPVFGTKPMASAPENRSLFEGASDDLTPDNVGGAQSHVPGAAQPDETTSAASSD
jgi:PRTRC genetic system protein E